MGLSLPLAAQVVIDNYPEQGARQAYELALIRGSISQAGEYSVRTVQPGPGGTPEKERPGIIQTAGGRFVALVRLFPGQNLVRISGPDGSTALPLERVAEDSPAKVRIIALTPSDGNPRYQTPYADDRQNYTERLTLAMLLLQTFTAESLNDQGRGRISFELERATDGTIPVHLVPTAESRRFWMSDQGTSGQLSASASQAISNTLPPGPYKNMVWVLFTRGPGREGSSEYYPELRGRDIPLYAHTAVGGGSNALMGGANIWTLPDNLDTLLQAFQDRGDNQAVAMGGYDGADRRQMVNIFLGASLHELGHALGLPHEGDKLSVMRRGYDTQGNQGFVRMFLVEDGGVPLDRSGLGRWDPLSMEKLAESPWLVPRWINLCAENGFYLSDGGEFATLVREPVPDTQWLALPAGPENAWMLLYNRASSQMLHIEEYRRGFVQTDRTVPSGYWSAQWQLKDGKLLNRWKPAYRFVIEEATETPRIAIQTTGTSATNWDMTDVLLPGRR